MAYINVVRNEKQVTPAPPKKVFDLKPGDKVLYIEGEFASAPMKTYAIVDKIYPHIFTVNVVAGDRTQHSFTKSQYFNGQVKRIEPSH